MPKRKRFSSLITTIFLKDNIQLRHLNKLDLFFLNRERDFFQCIKKKVNYLFYKGCLKKGNKDFSILEMSSLKGKFTIIKTWGTIKEPGRVTQKRQPGQKKAGTKRDSWDTKNDSRDKKRQLGYKKWHLFLFLTGSLAPGSPWRLEKHLEPRAGHLRYYFGIFFNNKKMIFCIFYQVNLTGSGLFKWGWCRNMVVTLALMKKCKKIIFITDWTFLKNSAQLSTWAASPLSSSSSSSLQPPSGWGQYIF